MTLTKLEISSTGFSRPSSPVVSMNLPQVKNLQANFVYNYYTPDERIDPSAGIPEYLKTRSTEQVNLEIADGKSRIARYVKLNWEFPMGALPRTIRGAVIPELTIRSNLDKIQTEESFLSSKVSSIDTTNIDVIADAAEEVSSIGQNDAAFFSQDAGWPQNQDKDYIEDTSTKSTLSSGGSTSSTTTTSISGKLKIVTRENSVQDQKINPLLPNSLGSIKNLGSYQVAGSQDRGFSPAKLVDTFNANIVKAYSENSVQTKLSSVRRDVAKAVRNIERIADNPIKNLGISFYDNLGKRITDKSSYQKLNLVSNSNRLNLQFNNLVSVDMFASASLPRLELDKVNKSYVRASKSTSELEDVVTQPAYVGPVVHSPEAFETSAEIVGYVITRSIRTSEGFEEEKTFTVESPLINEFVDTSILFGKIYSYSVRSVLRIDSTGYDDETSEVRQIAYYVSSRSIDTSVNTTEYVPPPPPVDLNFVWDYKSKKLQVVWGMPVNSQRDITQFQVFRRSRIEEPFELISQKCFDFSKKKYRTGEQVDGNVLNMSPDLKSLVEYSEQPKLFHIDEDFVVDSTTLKASKYIYTIASIDAHGMISNYSSQFEVTFDFFKNILVKKLVSSAGAPRPYPNMYVRIDAFKDVIKTSGASSTKLRIYFMPEYFKIVDDAGRIQRMVATKQSNSYYRLQFINLQNQKSTSLKITVDDPYELATNVEIFE